MQRVKKLRLWDQSLFRIANRHINQECESDQQYTFARERSATTRHIEMQTTSHTFEQIVRDYNVYKRTFKATDKSNTLSGNLVKPHDRTMKRSCSIAQGKSNFNHIYPAALWRLIIVVFIRERTNNLEKTAYVILY